MHKSLTVVVCFGWGFIFFIFSFFFPFLVLQMEEELPKLLLFTLARHLVPDYLLQLVRSRDVGRDIYSLKSCCPPLSGLAVGQKRYKVRIHCRLDLLIHPLRQYVGTSHVNGSSGGNEDLKISDGISKFLRASSTCFYSYVYAYSVYKDESKRKGSF